MSDITILSAVLGILGTICAIVFGYSTYKRNRKADDNTEGKANGMMLTEIGYIKSGIDDIKRKQEKQDALYVDVVTKLTAVEASAKLAHKRIDRIEGHSNREE